MKPNKYSREALLVALIALAALPMQQILLKQLYKKDTVSGQLKSEAEEEWSGCALSGNARAVILMAESNFKKGHVSAGEAWLKFGCMQLRTPSVMLYYGDYLRMKNMNRKAEYLYRFALKKALSENAPAAFIHALRSRLEKK